MTDKCTHPIWKLFYNEEEKILIFGCEVEKLLINDEALIRSKVASIMGKMGGSSRKKEADYSAMGSKGMKSRWGNKAQS